MTDKRMPKIISVALDVFIYPITSAKPPPSFPTLIKAMATEAPRSSKTMDTVVEVGMPTVLKKSNNKISVIMTAIKMIMISLNINS